jgi:hypothetical protein
VTSQVLAVKFWPEAQNARGDTAANRQNVTMPSAIVPITHFVQFSLSEFMCSGLKVSLWIDMCSPKRRTGRAIVPD